MKTLQELLTEYVSKAFEEAGYDASLGLTRLSDRPDLCEFQCNGAMMAAKKYHKAPLAIAEEVVTKIRELWGEEIMTLEALRPGFINIRVVPEYLSSLLEKIASDPGLGVRKTDQPEKILIDYGGPNVAKPLHVGHLRSAVIGESIKRILKEVGHEVLGDVHLGDWGLQMGLIIYELSLRKPELIYFSADAPEDEDAYPEDAPFTMAELEEIYPFASGRSKADEAYKAGAMEATHELQMGRPGYRALWKKIMELSIADLKRNYERLQVSFDLWKGESDVQPYIAPMVEQLKADGCAHYDQGALVIDVAEPGDKIEVPPCMVLKSDGASLYNTTDLATIVERMKLFDPDEIIYVVDKRQSLYFTQVFRAARKAGLAHEGTKLVHVGFGTMNGRDGKPFKTRSGGVMRLETLLDEICEGMRQKIRENRNVRMEDVDATAETVSLSAIKYGDLSNQASKDYVFDTEKFTAFEGNTGPYILYTIVRIKSILEKASESGFSFKNEKLTAPSTPEEKALMLELSRFPAVIEEAARELAPHRICAYVYETANDFNRFYHETRILSEEDAAKRAGYLSLCSLTRRILEKSIDILGFSAPDHM
ncbi:MAG: arginine--tRNA ligase [Lachnospiraceae bacterium]|nr:arginine--tRNA ligase [Lachnospiraceae bacterium]